VRVRRVRIKGEKLIGRRRLALLAVVPLLLIIVGPLRSNAAAGAPVSRYIVV